MKLIHNYMKKEMDEHLRIQNKTGQPKSFYISIR